MCVGEVLMCICVYTLTWTLTSVCVGGGVLTWTLTGVCVWMLAWTLMGVGVGGDPRLDINRCGGGERVDRAASPESIEANAGHVQHSP